VSAIDSAKGIGIVLVVFGHLVARDRKPLDLEWWSISHVYLYSFHMAFFFFLSGYVYFLQPADQWPGRLRKTAAKLVSAYVLFALIIYLAKSLAVHYMHVDRTIQEPLAEWLLLITNPIYGFAQYLWFIVCLLQIYTLMALLRGWVTRHFKLALLASLGLHLLSVTGHVTEFFALQQTTRYWMFFLLASVCHRYPAQWNAMVYRFGGVTFAAFVLALVILPTPWLATVAALLSLPALVAAAVWLGQWEPARQLMQFLGKNTLTIYLMNALALGLIRAMVLKFWGWDGWQFYVVAPILLTGGLLLPILAQRTIFARWAWTNRITK
jgi:fucose 4-O-acetylase-like acetyltransferase